MTTTTDNENEICCSPDSKCENDSTSKLLRYKPHYTSTYSDDAWEVKIAMPGVAKTDLNIAIENEILEVVGLRKVETPEGWKRLSGDDADRQYELRLDVGPEVDDTKIAAKLENGEVVVRLPLKDEAKPKTIPVS